MAFPLLPTIAEPEEFHTIATLCYTAHSDWILLVGIMDWRFRDNEYNDSRGEVASSQVLLLVDLYYIEARPTEGYWGWGRGCYQQHSRPKHSLPYYL